ncbi:MAG: hypothetical protein HQK73_06760 [Desulfamplus sp.]|nr:hypothetical protein [Desulfamplus sp.]
MNTPNRNLLVVRDSYLKNIKIDKEKGHHWIGIPVEIWSVFVIKNRAVTDILSSTVLRLVSTKAMSIEELHKLTSLDKDLLDYILSVELSAEVKAIGEIWKAEKTHNNIYQPIELKEFLILRSMVTGELIPRPASYDYDIMKEPDGFDKAYPFLSVGTKGKRFNITPFLLSHINPKALKRELTPESVLEAWNIYLQDYSSAKDIYGDDLLISADFRLQAIRESSQIHSIDFKETGYLLTTLMKAQEEFEGWSCSDPFGIFREGLPVLMDSVKKEAETNSSFQNILEQYKPKPLPPNIDVLNEIEKEFGKKTPKRLLSYLIKLHIVKEEWRNTPKEAKENKTLKKEQLFTEMQKVLESLLRSVWKRKKALSFFKADVPNLRNERINLLNKIMKYYDLADKQDLIPQYLAGKSIWINAEQPNPSLKSCLLKTLFSAMRYEQHPFNIVLHKMPDAPSKIIEIANFRNKGQHAQDEPDTSQNITDSDLQELLDKAIKITKLTLNSWRENNGKEKIQSTPKDTETPKDDIKGRTE